MYLSTALYPPRLQLFNYEILLFPLLYCSTEWRHCGEKRGHSDLKDCTFGPYPINLFKSHCWSLQTNRDEKNRSCPIMLNVCREKVYSRSISLYFYFWYSKSKASLFIYCCIFDVAGAQRQQSKVTLDQ